MTKLVKVGYFCKVLAFLLFIGNLLCCNAQKIKKEDYSSLIVELKALTQEVKQLQEKVITLETNANNIDPQCKILNNAQLSDLQCSDKWDKYEIGTKLNEETLEIYLRDTINKYIYWNSFDSQELQHIFNSKASLQNIGEFILKSARNDNKKFNISGDESDDKHMDDGKSIGKKLGTSKSTSFQR